MVVTLFCDMHSGGSTKVKPYNKIYIEAPKEEAEIIFYKKFGRNPYRVTCTCCGEDYSVYGDEKDFAQASAFHRDCLYYHPPGEEDDGRYFEKDELILDGWVPDEMNKYRTGYQTVEEYLQNEDVLFITADEIKPEEKIGKLPQQGYVWVDDDEDY